MKPTIGSLVSGDWDNEPNRNNKPDNHPPIEEVDTLADKIVSYYGNQSYRRWYCKIIYEFGVEQVEEWFWRTVDAKNPPGLFNYYVRQAKARTTLENSSQALENGKHDSGSDALYTPTDEELTPEAIKRNLDKAFEELEQDETHDLKL